MVSVSPESTAWPVVPGLESGLEEDMTSISAHLLTGDLAAHLLSEALLSTGAISILISQVLLSSLQSSTSAHFSPVAGFPSSDSLAVSVLMSTLLPDSTKQSMTFQPVLDHDSSSRLTSSSALSAPKDMLEATGSMVTSLLNLLLMKS